MAKIWPKVLPQYRLFPERKLSSVSFFFFRKRMWICNFQHLNFNQNLKCWHRILLDCQNKIKDVVHGTASESDLQTFVSGIAGSVNILANIMAWDNGRVINQAFRRDDNAMMSAGRNLQKQGTVEVWETCLFKFRFWNIDFWNIGFRVIYLNSFKMSSY